MNERLDVLTFGETMVSLRSRTPIADGGSLQMHIAGAESNVAIGLARLGHRTGWVGRLGSDPLGDLVLRRLRGEGVSTDLVVRDPVRSTGLMLLEQRTADLTRAFYHRAGSAGSALSTEDVRASVAGRPRVLHLTGVTPALSRSAGDAVSWAAQSASAAGVLVCVDINYRSRLWSRDQASTTVEALAPQAALIIASEDELAIVAPRASDEESVVQQLFDRGVRTVVVKRGPSGATAYTADARHDEPAAVVTVVDTVGAGDAFSAGYLSGVLDGLDAAESLHRALLLGAFAVSTHGDWEGLPTRDELLLANSREVGQTVR